MTITEQLRVLNQVKNQFKDKVIVFVWGNVVFFTDNTVVKLNYDTGLWVTLIKE